MRKPTKDWRQVKARYWKIVDEILRKSDIILNILDARYPEETRNEVIEKKMKDYGKKFIFILNKSDLVSLKQLTETYDSLKSIAPTAPVSCRDRRGKLRLIKLITSSVRKRPMAIGVVGYPNTGKSSIINYLVGRKTARTSPVAGFTRGMQWIRLSENIKLIDTPGVIPTKEREETDLALKSALTNIKDYEDVAYKILDLLIKKNKKHLEKIYNIKVNNNDPIETLKEIAHIKGKLKKGGEPDIDGASRLIVNDWQKGKLKV